MANRRILEDSTREKLNGMRTTVTAVRVSDDCAVFANAGDSRLYVFSGGRLQQLTRDDSWAAEVRSLKPLPVNEMRRSWPTGSGRWRSSGARATTLRRRWCVLRIYC